jgi:unsaturated rhamnogalacturonyl hydrolase
MLSMQRASWEQGLALQSMVELGNDELACLLAREAVLRRAADGRLAVLYSDNGATDPAACGEGVLYASRISGDPELEQAALGMLDYLRSRAPRSGRGVIYHTLDAPEIWSDSFYMAPPFLAAAGAYEEAVAQIEGLHDVLWNASSGLFAHRWHDGRQEFVDGRFWGGGNGWAAAGMARVIRALPEAMASERARLAGYHRRLLDGCLAHMSAEGLFHDYVDEPDTFVETNLSQMLAYSIFRGVAGGWLDGSYLEAAERMRSAARARLDGDGYVTGACGAPFFSSPGRSTEAQAFFLLVEAARADLDR